LTLTYAPADGSPGAVFDLAQLASGPIVVTTSDGDKMVLAGVRHDVCHHGFMRGRWHAVSADGGVYLGKVADAAGAPIGHVRGIYGHRHDGTPVMFGKFIDLDGKFIGILAGTYGDGDYKARWIDRGGDHGQAHGHYFEASSAAERGGFLGRWAEASCAEEPTPAPTPAPSAP
jgi:hypothetical protein